MVCRRIGTRGLRPWLLTVAPLGLCMDRGERRQSSFENQSARLTQDESTIKSSLHRIWRWAEILSACFGRKSGSKRMTGDRIRIRMEAYDYRALDKSAKEIVDNAKRTNARVCGPIPMPTRIERYTVLRSPHIDKKSREQFEMRTHKRVIDIFEPTARTIEALNRLVVPAGVFVKIKA